MVQNYHGRVIIKYRCKTGLKKKQQQQKNEVSHLQEKKEKQTEI